MGEKKQEKKKDQNYANICVKLKYAGVLFSFNMSHRYLSVFLLYDNSTVL